MTWHDMTWHLSAASDGDAADCAGAGAPGAGRGRDGGAGVRVLPPEPDNSDEVTWVIIIGRAPSTDYSDEGT